MHQQRRLPKWASAIRVRPYFGLLDGETAKRFCIVSSMAVSSWTFCIAAFELHLYAIVKHDVTYYGSWGMNYEFVYSGTDAVRSALIFFCVLSAVVSSLLFFTAALLLRWKKNFTDWKQEAFLLATALFVFFRMTAYIFTSFVNDPMYSYWVVMGLLNTLLILIQIQNGLVFWTLYLDSRTVICDGWGKPIGTNYRVNGDHDQASATDNKAAMRLQTIEVVAAQELVVFIESVAGAGRGSSRPEEQILMSSPVLIHQVSRDPAVCVYSL
ncbi:hypothetical protein BV898_14318 [Hypsibius exemplaris]|uniref:Uncharacterized protein n=1 Tax=Hypsibius exemplaris TaxID=2072580 RepID=A0A9X6NFC6_HYPEX|nr:hypothetical protein BV898_14318 [Hypsibius exemplaris]